MPLFVYISGYFSCNLLKNEDRALKTLIMFVVCQIAWIMFSAVVLNERGSALNWLIPGPALWYLIALAVWRGSLNILMRIKYVLIFSTVIAIFSILTGTLVPILAIPRIIGFLPFFLLGVYSHQNSIFCTLYKKIPLALAITVIPILLATSYFAVNYFGTNVLFVLFHNVSYDNINIEHWSIISILVLNILSYALAVVGGLSVMRIAVSLKQRNVLIFLGKRTLPIYVLSGYVQNIVLLLQSKFNLRFENDYLNYAISLIFITITLLILSSDFVNNMFNKGFDRVNRFLIIDKKIS